MIKPEKSIVTSVTKLIGAKPGAISDGGAAEVVVLTSYISANAMSDELKQLYWVTSTQSSGFANSISTHYTPVNG